MRWVILLVVLTGCPGPVPGDDDPTPDAPPVGPTALRVAWTAQPTSIPGPAGPDLELERVRFEIDNLRVVGDAGPLYHAEHHLEWDEQANGATIDFTDIPAGIYSRIVFEVDADSRIEGTVTIDGDRDEFRLERLGEVDVAFDIDIVLAAGDDRTQVIDIDLVRLLASLDFAALPEVSGRRILTAGDPQHEGFLAELGAVFVPQAATQN